MNHEILTSNLLQKRGYQGPGHCHFCLLEDESMKHIFFLCSHFRCLWTFICTKWNILWSWSDVCLYDFFLWVENLLALSLELAFLCLWEWWKLRDRHIFQMVPLDMSLVVHRVLTGSHVSIGRAPKSWIRSIHFPELSIGDRVGFFDGAEQSRLCGAKMVI